MPKVHHYPSTDSVAPNHLDVYFNDEVAAQTPDFQVRKPEDWVELFNGDWYFQVKTLSIVLEGHALRSHVTTSVPKLIETLPALQSVSVLSIGAPDPKLISQMGELYACCKSRGLRFVVGFVLDSQANACAVLAGQPTSLTEVLEKSRDLRTAEMDVCWLIPLLPELVFRLEMLFSLAYDERVEPLLISHEALGRFPAHPNERLTDDERLFAWDFISYRLLDEEIHRLPPPRANFYRDLKATLSGGGSDVECAVQTVAVLSVARLSPNERWHLRFEERTMLDVPNAVTHSGSNSGTGQNRIAKVAEVGGVLFDGIRALVQWSITQITAPIRRAGRALENEKLNSVMIIGAYGGEHIGDSAILGGVLNRIHRRYGTLRAILMSQRPVHTRHLVPMLELPVEIEVADYKHESIRKLLPQVDAVVFAGGPLIDLPKQLVRHLYAVSLARRQGKPFIMEGIGPGPFVRLPSEWVARRLVKMAQYLAVRTSSDAQQRLVCDLDPQIGRDPAFDYLETRTEELNRVATEDQIWIGDLLHGTEGRLVIGVNVRPIRDQYTHVSAKLDRAEYTRRVQSSFMEQFAEGLRMFHEVCDIKPCFVFFPMNAIQFGNSDLRSAYRLQRLLGGDVDFRVWEGDASLDGVVQLLRRIDVCVTMRFHATIFAMSQGVPVIGIDYRIGKRDKIGALMDDFNQIDNCCRIDELSAEWLVHHLSTIARTRQAH